MLALAPGAVRLDAAERGDVRPLGEILPLLRERGVRAVSANGQQQPGQSHPSRSLSRPGPKPLHGKPTVHCRFAGLPMGSPTYSCMASRLSCAGYLAAAGPSANARRMFAVTCLTKAGVRPPMPCGLSP